MFSSWFRRVLNGPSSTHRRPARRYSRLAVEVLEDRRVPSLYTVSNTSDSGAGSLRQAILDANSNPGADTIAFTIGSATITPATALPAISGPVTIDATTQSGYSGTPLVTLQGASSGQASYDGLSIT